MLTSLLDLSYSVDMRSQLKTLERYVAPQGHEPYTEWLNQIKDKLTKARIMNGVTKMEGGNFGVSESVGGGVFELKLDFGSGYRIYYALEGDKIILLLLGGDKKANSKTSTRHRSTSRIIGAVTMAIKKTPTKFRSVPHDEGLHQSLKDDPELAQAYLNVALEDEDPAAFLIAVKHVAAAYGLSMAEVATVAGVSREHVYELLSEKGNPKWSNIRAILKVLGAHLEIRLDSSAAKA